MNLVTVSGRSVEDYRHDRRVIQVGPLCCVVIAVGGVHTAARASHHDRWVVRDAAGRVDAEVSDRFVHVADVLHGLLGNPEP